MIDVESYHLGASLALRLAGQGHDVAIATPSESIATWCTWTLEGPRLRAQLHAAGVAMHTDVSPEAIVPGAVSLRSAHGGDAVRDRGRRGRARDAAALERGALPRARRPTAALAGGIEAVYRTGDCVAPRWLVDTVFDGHRLAREIDSADPAVYLPTLRERVVPS